MRVINKFISVINKSPSDNNKMAKSTQEMAWAIGACKKIYIYWLFIYSNSNHHHGGGFKKPIKIFTCSFFTPHKNQALPAVILGRSLDLSLDQDLHVILQGANLVNIVTTVSEMTISHNTKVLFLEVDNDVKLPLLYHRHDILSFYTLCKSPADYKKTTWDAALNLFIPGNRLWQQPINITMAPNIFLKTKLKMATLLQFIFVQQQQEQEQQEQQEQQQYTLV